MKRNMAQRNNSYTPEENAQILAQMEALKGKKIPANVYGTLAWTMGNRHTVASLKSQASRLRNSRVYGPSHIPAAPEKPPCQCQAAQPTAKEQPELPLYRTSEVIKALRVAADTLQTVRTHIIDRAALEEKCMKLQAQVDEYEEKFKAIRMATDPGPGGQA